jgi:hypothetical protein
MPRIRTIKPEFWADEKLAPMDPITRLVFLGLISMADDAGRLLDSLKQIDAMLFPLTDDTAREALANLSRAGRITRGKTASGQPIVQITNWRHQKVDHPNLAAALPPIHQVLTDDSREIREALATDSREIRDSISTNDLLPVPTTNDRKKGADAPRRAVRVYPPWVDRLHARWRERVGAASPSAIHRQLRSPVDAHGEPLTLAAIELYVDAQDERGKDAVLSWFGANYVQWIAKARDDEPIVADGWLTTHGEKVTR